MSYISLQNAINYLDTVREFIIEKDIPVAIRGNANYLAALGLSTYTEVLGGLYCGDLSGKKTKLNQNYICFIKDFFHPYYMKVNSDLEKDGLKGLYGAVRSGLTHEYFIKRISKIEMDNPVQEPITCGITYDPKSNPKIVFCVNQYFSDFKNAFEKYYNQLKNDTTGSMLAKFQDALQSIDSSVINKLGSSTFRSDLSGARVNLA
jgi:hypothetical protein